MHPLVSVIIPCFNVEEYIAACINSVLSQSYGNLEIICVDNNSTDSTWNLLSDLRSRHPQIRLEKEMKPGAGAARNKGLSLATGEWIQFLDADDTLMPEKIKAQIDFINSLEVCPDYVISPLYRKPAAGKIEIIPIVQESWHGLIIGRSGNTNSNLFRLQKLKDIGGWDENKKSSQESWLMFNLLKNGAKTAFYDVPLTLVNERIQGSISHTNKADNWERYIFLRLDIQDYLEKNGKITPFLKTVLTQNIFDSIRILYKEDHKKSVQLYDNAVKNKFRPVKSNVTSRIYLMLYAVMGFKITERWFYLLRK